MSDEKEIKMLEHCKENGIPHKILNELNKNKEYYENIKKEIINHEKRRHRATDLVTSVTLEPPIKLENIEEYEKRNDLKLPKDFRNYLLHISGETLDSYSLIIDLTKTPEEYIINESENYFITLFKNGCMRDLYLCIKGEFYGQVWEYDADGEFILYE